MGGGGGGRELKYEKARDTRRKIKISKLIH